jgi:7-cyano-7-deazaguanine synthase in queuosine biosynthesis
MSMLTSSKAGPINKTVLLFSGGLDSVCIAHLWKPDVLLMIPQKGSSYNAQEQKCITELRAAGFFRDVQARTLVDVLNLGEWERDDLIIPNRNAHLVLLAANFGDDILLGSVHGDRSNDKDETFFALMEELLDHMHGEQHWTEERSFQVRAPAKRMTKTELVREYLRRDGDPELLFKSWSCYGGGTQHCGQCKPCFRKRIALVNNDLARPGYWYDDFRWADWWPEVSKQIEAGEYRGREDQEVLDALDRMR